MLDEEGVSGEERISMLELTRNEAITLHGELDTIPCLCIENTNLSCT